MSLVLELKYKPIAFQLNLQSVNTHIARFFDKSGWQERQIILLCEVDNYLD